MIGEVQRSDYGAGRFDGKCNRLKLARNQDRSGSVDSKSSGKKNWTKGEQAVKGEERSKKEP